METKEKEEGSTMSLIDKAKHYITDKIAEMEKPEASIKDVDLKHFGREGLTYLAKVAVNNPYGVSIPICEIKYNLKSVNREIASGTVPDPGSLKGNEVTMLDVGIKVPHSVVVSLLKDICTDWDVDYVLEIGLVIDLPVIGNFTIPLSYKGEMKLPTFSDFFKRGDPEK